MKKHRLVKRVRWDDDSATSREWWELQVYVRVWFPLPIAVWVSKYATVSNEWGTFRTRLTGHREWAERIAKHYDITVPDEPDREIDDAKDLEDATA